MEDHNRFYKEEDGDSRSPYKRDVDRIVNSKAYARYVDKTQVVYLVMDDHLTTRSLHVQLVSNLARGLAEKLSLNSDLVEAISLGHDVGHPPFGHEGEEYLSQLSQSYGNGHFVHNLHSCRLLFDIEPLNLGLAVYDGFLCHSGGLIARTLKPSTIKTWDDHFKELEVKRHAPGHHIFPMTLEGCLVKLCDKVSYIGKDLEDALRLNLIAKEEIPKTCLGISNREILHAVAIDIFLHSRDKEEITLSEGVFESLRKLRQFNFERIYGHPKLKVESKRIQRAYAYLFETLLDDNQFLEHKQESYPSKTTPVQMVVDYIAGMTDRYFVRMVENYLIPKRIEIN